jgi:hypothetical protein
MSKSRYPAPQSDDAWVVTFSDSALLEADASNPRQYPIAALYYGGAEAANIAVQMASTNPVSPVNTVFQNVQPGSFLPVAVKQVRVTGTTAGAGTILCLVGKMGFQ